MSDGSGDRVSENDNAAPPGGVAIVGMAGRFPGAGEIGAFWDNIKAGRDCITRFSPADLEIPIRDATPENNYVCAKGMLEDVDMFDARFFGYLPREAELMDPQQRVFLELCWEALEHAGLDSARYPGAVGVYAGCYFDTYLLANLCADEAFRADLVESIQVGSLQTELGNDKDYLATRVAFKLGLRGPAMTLQTACSTSLVAIATACQALESYACDAALAGGVTIVLPQKKGYFYKEGGMLSQDGRCRTFADDAAGTVFSNGAAVLVLKRLEDALADGDEIYAVIRGYATNNDGGEKLSYTAPSIEGQAEVISLALKMADIDARTIGYVEAHGTATPLGDPIEIAGLTGAYRQDTDDRQYCAIGSVKANLGHLDCASGAIGVIKTAMALYEKTLPPQINFERPNPKIDFDASPFFVNTELKAWPESTWPRRAGVSSFGVGGTNAHVVLEEAPARAQGAAPSPGPHLLTLSARSEAALEAQAHRLADHLDAHPAIDMAAVAATLQTGRRQFDLRRSLVAPDAKAASALLRRKAQGRRAASAPHVVFVFPGQGAQHPGMGRGLYHRFEEFRRTLDTVADALRADQHYGADIREFILADGAADAPLGETLTQTRHAQAAIFAVELALARQLAAFGVRPSALIGHSIGEAAAAAFAGVMSDADAARFVAARGALMQAAPAGAMIAVRAPAAAVRADLPAGLSVAAINSDAVTIVSGPTDAIDAYEAVLAAKDIGCSRLKTSHAFHSAMMADAAGQLEKVLEGRAFAPGALPIYSTASGALAPAGAMASPAYWRQQLLSPVQFLGAVKAADADLAPIFLEVGPGRSLAPLIAQAIAAPAGDKPKDGAARLVASCLGPAQAPGDDAESLLKAVGQLWEGGVAPDWSTLHDPEARKIALPTYPFERKRFWVDPPSARPAAAATQIASASAPNPPPAGADALEQLVRQQLSVVEAQLRLLGAKTPR